MAPLLNKSLRAPRGRRIGDKMYGSPGGFRDGWASVCSYDVIERLAAAAAVDRAQAHKFMIALGKVAQAMLLAGEPVGIPHLGVLFLQEKLRTVNMEGLAAYRSRNGVATAIPEGNGTRVVRSRTPCLYISLHMRDLFRCNAVYTGDLTVHVARKRETLKKRLRRHKHGGLKHPKEA